MSTGTADGMVSLTIALLPPALIRAAVGDRGIYVANLAFLVFVLAAYMALNHFRRGKQPSAARVSVFVSGHVAQLAAVMVLLA